jgi:hypothetical protein
MHRSAKELEIRHLFREFNVDKVSQVPMRGTSLGMAYAGDDGRQHWLVTLDSPTAAAHALIELNASSFYGRRCQMFQYNFGGL